MDNAYVTRVLGLLGDRPPLEVLAELDAALDDLLGGLDDAALRTRPAPDRWSIAEVVAHLADTEIVYGHRLRLVLSEPTPRFHRFDQEGWAAKLDYAARPLSLSRTALRALRALHLDMLGRIDPADLDRAGVHESRGTETIGRMIRLWAGHDLAHRGQIERVRREVG